MITKNIDQIAQELAKNYSKPEELTGQNSIFDKLFQKTVQAALDAEMTYHLGYAKHKKSDQKNSRNGYTTKNVRSTHGVLKIATPRDRKNSFKPKIIKKNQTRFQGLDKQIISLYAKGLSTAQIQDQIYEIYGVDCSTSLISTVTNSLLDKVTSWQNRPLDPMYTIVYLDCLYVKIRDGGRVENRAIYICLAINKHGRKELLGMWVGQKESAKFWLSVLTELKNRGLEDILIACIDNLTGFKEAIQTVYPKTKVQLCIVHMIRNSLKFVSWKDRKVIAADLKTIYKSATVQAAKLALSDFKEKWKEKYTYIDSIWERNWEYLTTFFAYPEDIKVVMYTTNAIESLNMTLRIVLKNKRVFPSEESALKVLYLAIQRISKRWTMPIKNWNAAINRFIIEFGEERMKILT